jgi:hypothetical protein
MMILAMDGLGLPAFIGLCGYEGECCDEIPNVEVMDGT